MDESIAGDVYQVTLKPSGERFACAADAPILNAAHAANVLIAYSCRGGRCGACRGRVLRGEVAYPMGWPEALSAADAAAGLALFCSAHARSNLIIELVRPDFAAPE